jgi:hypothetical protein
VTAAQLAECLAILANAYPQDAERWTPERTQVWSAMLADLEYEELKGAIVEWVRGERWPPTIADLVERANGIEPRSALEAWGEVQRQIVATGSWGSPVFDDPLIQSALAAIGGWISVCRTENLPSERARFVQAYEVYARRAHRELACPPEIRARLLDRAIERFELLKGEVERG